MKEQTKYYWNLTRAPFKNSPQTYATCWLPANETLFASGKVDFNGISVGTEIHSFETHVDLPSGVYSDVRQTAKHD